MSKPITSSERVYDSHLQVNSCGQQWLGTCDHNTMRLNGRIDYSLYYIAKGMGYCEIDGNLCNVPEGSLMLYRPNTKQQYSFKKSDDSVMLWAHFTGTACKTLDDFTQSPVAIIDIQDTKQFESAFENMIRAFYEMNVSYETICEGYMTVLISLIVQNSTPHISKKSTSINENMKKVLSLMHLNYNKLIDIKEYAEICCICEEHFIRVFKSYTGLPPYRYQLAIRIKRAKVMLENTPISINECAEMVGFTDTAYFSKIFKRFTGIAPSHIRKQDNKT